MVTVGEYEFDLKSVLNALDNGCAIKVCGETRNRVIHLENGKCNIDGESVRFAEAIGIIVIDMEKHGENYTCSIVNK